MKSISYLLVGTLCCTLFLSFGTKSTEITTKAELASMAAKARQMSEVELIDRSTVLRSSQVRQVNISPDGSKISYLRPQGDEKRKLFTMWLYDVDSGSNSKLFTFKNIRKTFWSSDSQGLFFDIGHGVAYSGIDKGSKPTLIAKLDTEAREKVMHIDSSRDSAIIIRRWTEQKKMFALHRLDKTGKDEKVYQLQSEFSRVVFDDEGKPDVLIRQNRAENAKGEFYFDDLKLLGARRLWQCDWDDDCLMFYFDRKNQRLLLQTNKGGDLLRLVWADVKTGKLTEVHQDPLSFADMAWGSYAYEGKPLLAVYHGDTRINYALTEQMDKHLKLIEGRIGSAMLFFDLPENRNPFKTRWLVRQRTSQQAQWHYHVYDPVTQSLSEPLKHIIAKADSKTAKLTDPQLAPKFAIRYPTTDGYSVPGYLTLPRGVDIKKAPLVVNVHGGPWSRVGDGLDRRGQLLANRGYILFEPNFRASTGYGKAHMVSIAEDFGDGRVQQDITDGVRYLLEQGIGDADRVAIVGHSFGGFSTLTALAVTPELFKVGFAGAPPTDLGRSAKLFYRFEKKVHSQARDHFMKTLVVDWEDKAAFAENAKKQPLNLVDKVTKPLVIWAGKHDRRVFIVDVNDYATKAQSLGKRLSLFVDGKAMHSPSGETPTLAYIYLMEKTLAMHIGGKLQPLDKAKDGKLQRLLKRQLKIDDLNVLAQIQPMGNL